LLVGEIEKIRDNAQFQLEELQGGVYQDGLLRGGVSMFQKKGEGADSLFPKGIR